MNDASEPVVAQVEKFVNHRIEGTEVKKLPKTRFPLFFLLNFVKS